MALGILITVSLFVAVLFFYCRSKIRDPNSNIRGPKSKSWLIGNLGELLKSEAGETDFRWQSQYGGIVRFKAAFGENWLLVSDPKAIRHILHMPNYRWERNKDMRNRSFLMTGPGISSVSGTDHRRHRRAMQPGFGGPASRALLPVFFSAATALSNTWRDLIVQSEDQSKIFNVSHWLSRATLDAIGHAAFDYQFGAMEDANNQLTRTYRNVFADIFGSPSGGAILSMILAGLLPRKCLTFLRDHSFGGQRLERLRSLNEVTNRVARQLVREKAEEIGQGKGNKDIMSLLVKANLSEDERSRMSDDELIAQMSVIFTAGHETTANSLSWTLLELSRHPEVQKRLRDEIQAKKQEVASRGNTTGMLTVEDLEMLPYLGAVVKESLRYHTVAIHVNRTATADDIIPLSEPILASDGRYLSEIPVKKGQKVVVSLCSYNRNKSVFGEDAHMFNPDRWFKNTKAIQSDTSVGVYANLATFSGGLRSCIGWRFAILELQAFIVQLISDFEFSLTPQCSRIRRESARLMLPMLEGEREKGVQCPLLVKCTTN
uniref:Cytochrome p450 n=1 Tax=Moniliophthora roreri TaxID=221103 RepID=A0A0W0GAR6_MONRR